MLFLQTTEWLIARDAEGGGLGGGGGTENGAGSDGAAGGFADAGNASASFDGSVSATAGGVGNSGLDSFGSFGGAGGSTVDLGQSGASPSASSAMQFSATDAATLGGLALGGVAAIATTSAGWGLAITAGAALMDAGPVADAVSHAAHDAGVLGADPALANAPSIGMFGTEAQAIDAMNLDGGFDLVSALNGTDSIWDVSVGGNIAAADHVGGHSLYWDNALGLPT
jgi:hypothetical protein